MEDKHMTFAFLYVVLFVILVVSVNGSVWNNSYSQALPISCETPNVILQQGTAGSSTIYTNSTSAKVSVDSTTETYDYVLKVVKVADNWTVNLQVYDSSNISRLSSLNISLHDGASSNQIAVSGGSIVKSEGEPYNLPGGAGSTIYISITNLQEITSGTSYLYVYLKILVPDTSTYSLYIITFEIT